MFICYFSYVTIVLCDENGKRVKKNSDKSLFFFTRYLELLLVNISKGKTFFHNRENIF